MREIKFRYVCKDAEGDIFTFVTTIEDLERAKLNVNTYGRIETIEARNLFTGLHDKNGKEIYEGDIVRSYTGEFAVMIFHAGYNSSGFQAYSKRGYTELLCTPLKIISNIYENPELLKGV